jgi:hypothetical protein
MLIAEVKDIVPPGTHQPCDQSVNPETDADSNLDFEFGWLIFDFE